MPATLTRRLALCLATAAAAIMASPAAAWGPIGHRITAEIAQHHVSGQTRAHIEQILGHEQLPESATWPDEQRSSPDPFWRTAGPWHYVTLPEDAAADALQHPPEGDAVTALDQFTAVLRDPAASPADRARALRLVVHIVGDLHMPLHTGKDGDRGGNDFRVTWFDEPQNLHWVWDEGMINRQQLSYSEYAARLEARTTPQQVIDWWDARPLTWLDESIGLRNRIYPATGPEIGLGTQEAPVPLSWQYQYDWVPDMELRLQQAGIRIAAYLDDVFAQPR
jgi:hypothetical protein